MYISELISKIDIKIEASQHVIAEANDNIERFKLLKESIQSICTHRHKDGSEAFEEYAHPHNRSLQRCSICQREVTL